MDVPLAVILGNSSGCRVAAEFAHRYPDRTERAVLVSPAGGRDNRPLLRGVMQLARDGLREPPSLARIAVPDYVRFGLKNSIQAFRHMTRYPHFRAAPRMFPYHSWQSSACGTRSSPSRKWSRILQSPADVDVVRHVDAAHAINFEPPRDIGPASSTRTCGSTTDGTGRG